VPASSSTSPPTIDELDAMPGADAVAALVPLFEGPPRFLARLAAERPFENWDELFARAESIALVMPEDERIELIDAHPRLGAPPATMSSMSFLEQGYDRDQAGAIEELDRLNEEYEARFGFRYCVFVAGRPRAALLPELRDRLHAARGVELERAIRDVVAIARDRHRRLSEGTP
jgi:2-oxo-4-hydroxy-4-carboxy-5-ureidoimidazoline decarboxylase